MSTTTTKISWTDRSWNPVRGCSLVSRGCTNCYAMGIAARFSGPGQAYEGLATWSGQGNPRWTGRVELVDEALDEPIRWKRPARIFVNSMSDLFHEELSDEAIAWVHVAMAYAGQHHHQTLTKRAERQAEWTAGVGAALTYERFQHARSLGSILEAVDGRPQRGKKLPQIDWPGWPLPNVWHGVSVEDQETANERLRHLVATRTALPWVSMEPLLERVNVSREVMQELAWIVVGFESGRHARPGELAWIRWLIDQARDVAGPKVYVKQLGQRPYVEEGIDFRWVQQIVNPRQPPITMRDTITVPSGPTGQLALSHYAGADPEEWPADLRVREFPRPHPREAA